MAVIGMHASGTLVDIAKPAHTSIHPEDIVWGLSHQNRYAGQTPHPYTIGQHEVAIMRYMHHKETPNYSRTLRQVALLHDFPEYVLQDLTNPLKRTLRKFTLHYDRLTVRWEDAICERFGTNFGGEGFRTLFDLFIKQIDFAAYIAEVHVLDLKAHFIDGADAHKITPDKHMVEAVRSVLDCSPERIRSALNHYIETELEL